MIAQEKILQKPHLLMSQEDIYGHVISADAPGYTYAYGNRRKHTLDLIQKVAKPGAKILVLSTIQGNFTF